MEDLEFASYVEDLSWKTMGRLLFKRNLIQTVDIRQVHSQIVGYFTKKDKYFSSLHYMLSWNCSR